MRAKDIIVNTYYRFKDHPNYSFARALIVLKPKTYGNSNPFIVVKCEHVVNVGDTFGMVRYFRPRDLIKEEVK